MDPSNQPAGGAAGHGVAGDSIVLEEEIDQNYVPSEEEVREYAKWLGMELQDDLDLFWIAKEGLKAPLPENWKPCKTVDTDEIYYFNFATGESTWDHPCDEYYRKLYEEEKKKKITKDKAKHDKSKQQAKKDVNQLLGRDKKKKSRPTGKRPTHRSSPERAQAKPLSASSVLDRKPLPGIGRLSVQGGHTVDSQASVSSPTPSDKALTLSERSPSRTQTSSLVGHRLSQHLSVSVESEEGIRKNEDGGRKPSSLRTPVRSDEENATTPVPTALAAGVQSEHEAVLKELRREHARDLDALEQAHSDTKHELEADHRRNMATKKRQWAASAEAQSKKARDAMTHELQATRANHSREIDNLECSLLDAKARMEKAVKETEEAREAAHAKKGALESSLAELERQVVEEKENLQEAREAAQKVQALELSQPGEDLRRELARVLLELEDERKHVAELQGRVKEAHSAIRDDFNCAQQDGEGVGTNLVLLQQKLADIICENEGLRKEAARATSLGVGGRYGEVSPTESGSTQPEHTEITSLKRALRETEMRLSDLQRAQDQSTKDAKDAAAALANAHDKAAGLERDNHRLVAEVAQYRIQVQGATSVEAQNLGDENTMRTRRHVEELQGQDTGTQTSLPLEHDGNAPTKQLDTEGLRADLEASRNEAACFASDVHKSKELETLVRNELHAAQLALRESQLKIAELSGNLATADHEKKLNAVTTEELRLENACLKRNMEVLRSASEGDASRQVADTLVDELKEVRVQLATTASERDGLNDEIGAIKQQLVRCEGVRKAEREMFDSSLANQQRQSESLQTTVKRLEVDMLAGQQREEALHTAAKLLRENVAASKLEVWRLQENLRETTGEAERVASDLLCTQPETAQTSCQKGECEVELASTADLAKATAATAKSREMASRLQLAEDQVDQLQARVQETMTKLVDSQGIAASLQEELDKARGSEKDTAQHLDDALFRCAKTEENLAKACDDRVSLEHALRYAKRTSVTEKQCSDLEQSLRRSQGELEQAKTDLVSSKQQAADLQQRLSDSTAEANRAMEEARHNREIASTRQKEIASFSEREQGLQRELLEARTSLHTSEKDCERVTVAAEQAKRDLADAKSIWREETSDLKVALKEALATVGKKDEKNMRAATHKETSPLSPVVSEVQARSPLPPEVPVDGNPTLADEGARQSASGTSDATSRGLADELMQSLENNANQRCSNGPPALSEKASRSWKNKLMEERKMLAQAKEAVRHHKERVKRRQQRILLCQTRWRQQSESFSPTTARPRHSSRHRSLEDSKRELDSEVRKLNKFVQQLRSSKCWLDQREKKVSEFETLLAADSSGLGFSPEQYPSRVATSGEQTSSSESSTSGGSTHSNTSQLRSLEAMQQELDNDFSDFTEGSSVGDFNRPRAMHGDRKPTRTQRHAPKKGKENTLPGSRPAFPIGYPFSAFPGASGFWIHPSHAFLGELPPSPAGVPSRSRASRPKHNARHQGRGLGSGFQVNVDGNQDYSELDFQRWLNRPDLDTRDEVRSGIAARERREHFAKLSVEGKLAQSTVALHVDWLNTLREEMGLLGFHSAKNPSISTHVEV